jgi:hypothetical protein
VQKEFEERWFLDVGPWLCRHKLEEAFPSSVGIATGSGLEGRDSIPGSKKISSSPYGPDRLWDQLSPVSNKYKRQFPQGLKRAGHEPDLSSSNAEIKNGGAMLQVLN